MSLSTLKWAAILCFVVAMVVLLGGGISMKNDLPPYPGKVIDPGGNVLFQKSDILAGQDVYQRYGFLPSTVGDEPQRLQISRFFFWTAWVASTLRPGTDHTYTNN